MAPFKPGSFKIAAKTGCPVVVVGLKNNHATRGNAPWRPTTIDCHVLKVVSPAGSTTTDLSQYRHDLIDGFVQG